MKTILQLLILCSILSYQTETTQDQLQLHLPDGIEIEPLRQKNQIEFEQIVEEEIDVVFDTIKRTVADTIFLGTPARYYSKKDTVVANHRFIKYRKWKHSRELIVFPNDSFSYELVFYLDGKRISTVNPFTEEEYKLTGEEFKFYKGYCSKEIWKYKQLEDSLFYLERQIGETIDRGYANSLIPYNRQGHQFITTTLEGDTLFTIDYLDVERSKYNFGFKNSTIKYYLPIFDSIYSIENVDSFDKEILLEKRQEVENAIQPVCMYGNPEGLSLTSIIITTEGRFYFDKVVRTNNYYEEVEINRMIHTLAPIKPFTKNGKPVNVNWFLPIRFRYE